MVKDYNKIYGVSIGERVEIDELKGYEVNPERGKVVLKLKYKTKADENDAFAGGEVKNHRLPIIENNSDILDMYLEEAQVNAVKTLMGWNG